jgi:hypothetical protein
MKRNTLLVRLSRLFVILFLVLCTQSLQLSARNKTPNANGTLEHSSSMERSKKHDKNLIKGIWGRTDGAGEINISEVLDNGLLKATFCNPKSINIEKAVWTNSSDVLRIYILFREDNYPGSSFTLNYMAEKDLLLGMYFDALANESQTVTFKRVK